MRRTSGTRCVNIIFIRFIVNLTINFVMIAHVFWVSFADMFIIKLFHIVFLYSLEEGRMERQQEGRQEDRRTGENPKFAHMVLL